jgi:hypothetical protein
MKSAQDLSADRYFDAVVRAGGGGRQRPGLVRLEVRAASQRQQQDASQRGAHQRQANERRQLARRHIQPGQQVRVERPGVEVDLEVGRGDGQAAEGRRDHIEQQRDLPLGEASRQQAVVQVRAVEVEGRAPLPDPPDDHPREPL